MSETTGKQDSDVRPVTDADFSGEVLESDNAVLVDFWAPWCGPCRMLAPTLDELAGDYAGRVKVRKLNVDENQATARQFGVLSIPTVLLFRGGKVVDTFVGVQPKQAYQAVIDRALG